MLCIFDKRGKRSANARINQKISIGRIAPD